MAESQLNGDKGTSCSTLEHLHSYTRGAVTIIVECIVRNNQQRIGYSQRSARSRLGDRTSAMAHAEVRQRGIRQR